MALAASRLGPIHVFRARNGIKMRRIHTVTYSAGVVQFQPAAGQFSVRQEVAEPMSHPLLALVEKLAVTGSIKVADEQPARLSFVDFLPKPNDGVGVADQGISWFAFRMASPMGLAKSARVVLTPAPLHRTETGSGVLVDKRVAVSSPRDVVLGAPPAALVVSSASFDRAESHTASYNLQAKWGMN